MARAASAAPSHTPPKLRWSYGQQRGGVLVRRRCCCWPQPFPPRRVGRPHHPSNDRLQRENARDVILGTDADIWGVAEIVDVSEWKRLKEPLPEYDGFVASEGPVSSRGSHYQQFSF